jgi:hypothetical protein
VLRDVRFDLSADKATLVMALLGLLAWHAHESSKRKALEPRLQQLMHEVRLNTGDD